MTQTKTQSSVRAPYDSLSRGGTGKILPFALSPRWGSVVKGKGHYKYAAPSELNNGFTKSRKPQVNGA
ncbi:MAG: hypothetical protein ABIP71_11775 [Verrucomicrobiota bacterium]